MAGSKTPKTANASANRLAAEAPIRTSHSETNIIEPSSSVVASQSLAIGDIPFCYSTSLASQTTGPARTRRVERAAPVTTACEDTAPSFGCNHSPSIRLHHGTLTCFADPKRPAMSLFGQ